MSDDSGKVFIRNDATDTSAEAGEAKRATAASDESLVLEEIRKAGDHGLVDDEGEVLLDIIHQTYSARRRALSEKWAVVDSGRRRKTRKNRPGIVWILPRFPGDRGFQSASKAALTKAKKNVVEAALSLVNETGVRPKDEAWDEFSKVVQKLRELQGQMITGGPPPIERTMTTSAPTGPLDPGTMLPSGPVG